MTDERKVTEWTPAMEARLTKLTGEGVSDKMIAERMHLTPAAVTHRRMKLGLPGLRPIRPFTPEEDLQIRAFIRDRVGTRAASVSMGRSINSVVGRARILGLAFSGAKPKSSERPSVSRRIDDALDTAGLRGVQTRRGSALSSAVATDLGKRIETHAGPVAIPTGAKRLVDLEFSDCRWIVAGEGAHALFCASPKAGEGTSYCAEHKARSASSYQPKEVQSAQRRFEREAQRRRAA